MLTHPTHDRMVGARAHRHGQGAGGATQAARHCRAWLRGAARAHGEPLLNGFDGGKNDRHRLGMNGSHFGVRICLEKSEQLGARRLRISGSVALSVGIGSLGIREFPTNPLPVPGSSPGC